MNRTLDADYSQPLMFPPSLEDWVPPNHPARFLREFVDALDLDALGFAPPANEVTGRPAYAPSLLLKVWLYGYLNRLRSSRALERAGREHLSLVWLTGNHAPDHNTLWRFFKANRAAMKRLFAQSVRVAADAGLVSMALHAVDGTRIAASASHRTVWKRGEIEALLARLDASVEEAAQAVERAEASESGSYRLPEALADREVLRQRIRAGLAKHPHAASVSLSDPDAHPTPIDGRTRPGYNAQAVADENRLLVAAQVAEETNDAHQLNPMLEETAANLGTTALETVADAGYVHAPSLAEAESNGHSVTVSLKGAADDRLRDRDDRYHQSNFRYDAATDTYRCPENGELTFQRETPNAAQTYPLRVYHCRAYASCPRRWECSANRRGRTIKRNPHEAALAAQRAKGRSPEGRARLTKRKAMIEPVFAVIKEAMGFRRFTAWGLESVRAQWMLVATAYNLLKLRKYWMNGRLRLA